MRAARRVVVQSAYKRLLKAALAADAGGTITVSAAADGSDEASLTSYVRSRMREEVDLVQRAATIAAARQSAAARGHPSSLDGVDLATLVPSQVPDDVVDERLTEMANYTRALQLVDRVSEVADAVRALSLGVGSIAYRRTVEASVIDALLFQMDREERQVADDASADDRQNAVMLQALAPFAEKLAVMHRDGPDPAHMATLMAARRSTTRSFYVDVSVRYTEAVHVDVDDSLGKQVVYVRTCGIDAEAPDTDVEVRMLTSLRRAGVHAEWSLLAERLLEVMEAETPLHASRATTVVGHGVGGAVAVCLSLLLLGKGYAIRNTVTFGAPKVCSHLLQRDAAAINHVRVCLTRDPRPDFPTSDDDRAPFFHFGELLELDVLGEEAPPPSPGGEDADAEPMAQTSSGEEDSDPRDFADVAAAEESSDVLDPCPMSEYWAAMSKPGVHIRYSNEDEFGLEDADDAAPAARAA